MTCKDRTICETCGKEFTNNNIKKHTMSCSIAQPNKVRGVDYDPNHGYKDGSRIGKNQFTKAKSQGVELFHSEETINKLREIAKKQPPKSKEVLERLSILAKERCLGGHTSKRSIYFKKKSGETVYLQSSYEIEFATLLEEMNIEWERPAPLHWIDDEGKDHRYYPDFKFNSVYIDTKNDYLAIKDARKIELVNQQNQINVIVVSKNQINKEFIALLV